MEKQPPAGAKGTWHDRSSPRTFEEKAYRLQQGFTDWIDANVTRLKFKDDGDWIVTRVTELLLLEKAAECSSRLRVEALRQVASDLLVRVVADPTSIKKIEIKVDEMFSELEAHDEMGLNDPRYKAKVRTLAESVAAKVRKPQP